uniref:Prospero domain-containing protein n=1 Tax=Knipowitschia caucasica TaxID=637954 RepID=A0AAV2LB60_KNICA
MSWRNLCRALEEPLPGPRGTSAGPSRDRGEPGKKAVWLRHPLLTYGIQHVTIYFGNYGEQYGDKSKMAVPERFLEVSQVTLREFFNAIVAGKDADPSWKKAIYKVICKLDSEVPEVFKSPNCLQELLHD